MPSRARTRSFTVPLQDLTLHVAGDPDDLYEEVRAAGMGVFERIQAYGVNNKVFGTSKRPVYLPEDAPPLAREMADAARAAGVGPMFTFRGALVESVGRTLAGHEDEVHVRCGGNSYVVARRRARLPVRGEGIGGHALAVVIKPELGPHGICTTFGRGEPLAPLPPHGTGTEDDGVAVVASSAMLAAAAATAVRAILLKRGSLGDALAYLRGLPGVFGGLLARGGDIGLAGGLELAA